MDFRDPDCYYSIGTYTKVSLYVANTTIGSEQVEFPASNQRTEGRVPTGGMKFEGREATLWAGFTGLALGS